MSVTQQQIERIERLAVEIEGWTDTAAQATTRELLQEVLALHASGLQRILALFKESGDCGGELLLCKCMSDPLLVNLFLLHGLHPQTLDDRVAGALDSVRPYLQSHGGDVELLSLDDGTVHLRLSGSCHGCPSSAATMKNSIEKAIYEAAPDVNSIEVASPAAKNDLLQIGSV